MQRYGVSGSAGQRDGKSFAVWDRHKRRAVSYHRTFRQAQTEAKRLNQGA